MGEYVVESKVHVRSNHFHYVSDFAFALGKRGQMSGDWYSDLQMEAIIKTRSNNQSSLTWQSFMLLSKHIWNGNALQNVNGDILFSNASDSTLLIDSTCAETETVLSRGLLLSVPTISNCMWSQSCSPLCLIMFTSTFWSCSFSATACQQENQKMTAHISTIQSIKQQQQHAKQTNNYAERKHFFFLLAL